MKRSDINAIIRQADDFIRAHGFHLPPFAHWTPEEWQTKGPEVREIVDRKLGWDVTDFNLGEHRHTGLLLFTVRNGAVKDPASKPYAEKIMMVDADQITPTHFHWHKMEDIINRGGGHLVIQLFNSTPDETLDHTDVTINTDGVQRTVKAGDSVTLKPGESITLPACCYHKFWGADWQGDRYLLWAEATLRETSVFGVNLVMTRRISTTLDEAKMWIEDRVENRGRASAPLMLLQHFKLGWPLVDSAARLILPAHTTVPCDAAARPGLDRCLEFDDPIDDYAEQVFYHDLQADASGSVEVRLINPAFNHGQGLGVAWRYPQAKYPIPTEWKMLRAGFYAVGLEPGNCHVEGRVKERERGTLRMIAPQEARTFHIELEFFNL